MFSEKSSFTMKGHVLIDDEFGNILVDENNAIHDENMSFSIAKAMTSSPEGHIHEMHFGNGGSVVQGTGSINYFPPNTTGLNAELYNSTFYKVVDDSSPLNDDPPNNFTEVNHINGEIYTDIKIVCTLDYNEPQGQQAFDDAVNNEGDFVFDELGLKTFDTTPTEGLLISHVVFHPVQKSLNRRLRITYHIRIQMC